MISRLLIKLIVGTLIFATLAILIVAEIKDWTFFETLKNIF